MPPTRRTHTNANGSSPYLIEESSDIQRIATPSLGVRVIDLSSDSDEDSEQQAEHETVIQRNKNEGDPRLSFLKCVICLDSPTDLTATNCGHLFCHECITAALRVGGSQTGNCPVCRRKTMIKNLIPLNILKGHKLGAEIDVPLQVVAEPQKGKRTTVSSPRRTKRTIKAT